MSVRKRAALVLIAGLAGSLALTACAPGSLGSGASSGASSAAGAITLTYLVDNGDAAMKFSKAQADAFTKANPNITITIVPRPQGGDGDNLVKTKLATGEMEDLLEYNSGSLLSALDPAKNFVALTGEAYMSKLDSGFKQSVTVDGQTYGVPNTTATGGGILYSRKIYDQLGLTVPKTWAEFMANSAKIKDAGIDPVIQSYADTWTSQLLVLADYANVSAVNPDWATKFTANDATAKFALDPAVKGFQRLEDVHKAGFLNKNFASLKYDQALKYLSDGKGAQYPMLTFAVPTLIGLSAGNASDIGFFGQPGDDASTGGMTLWEPSATYIPTTTTGAKLDAAKKFVEFLTTPEACDAQNAVLPPSGPWVVQGCKLPSDVSQAVKDMQVYVDAGTARPALEFLSPVKGPNLEKITVEVGSGIASAADGAKRYDEDVKKQAQQLGLQGW